MSLECINLNGIQVYLVMDLHQIELGFSILLLQKCKYASAKKGPVNKKDLYCNISISVLVLTSNEVTWNCLDSRMVRIRDL